jgi:hypothetical protein
LSKWIPGAFQTFKRHFWRSLPAVDVYSTLGSTIEAAEPRPFHLAAQHLAGRGPNALQMACVAHRIFSFDVEYSKSVQFARTPTGDPMKIRLLLALAGLTIGFTVPTLAQQKDTITDPQIIEH